MFENLNPKSVDWHSGIWPYLGVIAMSIWGGLTKYMSQEVFTWRTLVAQLLSSSFAGMLTFMSCQYVGISGPLVGVLCGVASHLGTPAIINLAMKLKIVRDVFEQPTQKKE